MGSKSDIVQMIPVVDDPVEKTLAHRITGTDLQKYDGLIVCDAVCVCVCVCVWIDYLWHHDRP